MWFLELLPSATSEFIINALLILGGLATVISFLFLSPLLRIAPSLTVHYKLIQIISLVVLCVGIYLKGGFNTEKVWRDRVADVERKLKIAEAKSETVNVVIQEKVVNKDRIIRERGEEIIKYLDREVIKIKEVEKFIEVCPIPVDIIKLHNEATKFTTSDDKK